MDVNWFPGHMTRALRDIKPQLKLVDMVIELCDARLPLSSRNPEIAKLISHKPRLLVMSKSDLADPKVTEAWLKYYREQGETVIAINSLQNKGIKIIASACKDLVQDVLQRAADKGRHGRVVRAMVLGIPNTGKSTLINSVAGRKAAVTSDRPGVTRAPQWIRSNDIELMDMPGVLWPKIETDHAKLVLAASGAIRDQVLDVEEIAYLTLDKLLQEYKDLISMRFKLQDLDLDTYQIYEQAARNRGCVLSGGRINSLRFATLFLDELRGGKIGAISLERPELIVKGQ